MALTAERLPNLFSTAEELWYEFSVVVQEDVIQRLLFDYALNVGGNPVLEGRAYSYFSYPDTNARFSFFERLRKRVSDNLIAATWQAQPFPVLETEVYEQIDGAEEDSYSAPDVYLINSDTVGFLITGSKFWASKNGQAILSVQNATETGISLLWQVEVFGKGESSIVETAESLPAASLGSFTVDFSSSAYDGLVTGIPYKFIVRCLLDGGTPTLIDEVEYHFAPESEFYKEFWYINEHNAWEVLPCMGGERVTLPRTIQDFEYEYGFGVQIERTQRTYEVNSQSFSNAELEHYSELLKSEQVLVRDGSDFHRIYITSKSADIADSDIFQGRLNFNYRYAEISR